MLCAFWCLGSNTIPLTVENSSPGAPITLGIPFPVGALHSPDNVRLLDVNGKEVPAQITEVTTWKPVDPSMKWIWVFFFAGENNTYTLEYGEDVHRAAIKGDRIKIINGQNA